MLEEKSRIHYYITVLYGGFLFQKMGEFYIVQHTMFNAEVEGDELSPSPFPKVGPNVGRTYFLCVSWGKGKSSSSLVNIFKFIYLSCLVGGPDAIPII